MADTGAVYVWGPQADSSPDSQPPGDLGQCTKVLAILLPTYAFAAIREDGDVQTWGPTAAHGGWLTVPTGLHNVVDLQCPYFSSVLALDSAGRVWSWGGDSDSGVRTDLDAVPSGALSGVAAIYADVNKQGGYALAVKTDGSVIGWGSTFYYPAAITDIPGGLTGVKKLQCNGAGVLALKTDGTFVSWGTDNGQNIFTPAASITGVVDFAFYYDWAIAVKSDGTIVTWGISGSGWDVSAVTDATRAFAGYSGMLAVNAAGAPYYFGSGFVDGTVRDVRNAVIDFGPTTILASNPYSNDTSYTPPDEVTQLLWVDSQYNDDLFVGVGVAGPPPVTDFWTDTRNARFSEDTPTVLTKPSVTVFNPGSPGSPEQFPSLVCPSPPPPVPPPNPPAGLHGCYTNFKFVNANTGATGSALVPSGGTIPPAYTGPGWYTSSYSQVCYA